MKLGIKQVMNKHFYRVIFNKKRNIQMAVADIAKTPSVVEKTTKSASYTLRENLFVTLKPITLFISISLGFVALSTPAYGSDIKPDQQASHHQQPQVVSTANGVTQVNIQAPNSKGLSHNKYSQFDVSQNGVILNNGNKISQTQIGGYIQGNPNLKVSGPAKIILNEVNSRNPSQLNGVVEVAGGKAQVIIANPSGITCNGCGFINANRGTLTTGKPVIENGELKGYLVEQGQIAVTGKGFDSSRQSYTDLIARSVSINSSVWANEANVVTGRNNVSLDVKTISPLDTTTHDKPEVSIDVSQLGGMYAGKINLVGTEKGVGVHNAGELGASRESLMISADGKIVNNGAMQSNKDIVLNSNQGVINNKQLYAKNEINIKSTNNINNSGTIVAQKDIKLSANKIDNASSGTIAAGVDSAGKLNNHGSLTVSSHQLTSKGKLLADQKIAVESKDKVDLDGGQQIANQIDIKTKALSAKQSVIKATQDVNLTTENNLIVSDSQIFANKDINLIAGQTINMDNSTIVAKDNIYAQGQDISLQNANTLSEKDSTFIANQNSFNREAQISTKGNLYIKANHIDNDNATLLSEQDISLISNNQLINRYAKLFSNRHITLSASEINNQNAKLKNLGTATITANLIDNQHAVWRVDQLILKSGRLLNKNANMLIQKIASFDTDEIVNENAKILAHDLFIQSNKLSGDGQLLAENNLTLKLTDSFHNQNEVIANNNIVIESQQNITNDKTILSGKKVNLISKQLTNNEDGEISSDDIQLEHDIVTNFGIIDGQNSYIGATTLNNIQTGRIYSNDLQIKAQTINNRANGNQAPVIAARNNFIINAETLNNYSHALLLSLGKLTINADTINNHSSRIESGDNMIINANEINNINDNIQTEVVKVSEQNKSEFAFRNSNRRYSGNNYQVKQGKGKHKYPILTVYNEDGSSQSNYKYIEYNYLQTHYQTQITQTDPAEIVSGNHLVIDANRVINNNSKIVAGGTLQLNVGSLDNISEKGIDRIIDSGKQISHDREWHGGTKREYSSKKKKSDYNNIVETTIDLGSSKIDEHQSISNTTIDDRDKTTTNVEVDQGDRSLTQINSIASIEPNLDLPNNSLYAVKKDPKSNYLIETDPRFTNRKKWLSSDYMANQLKMDPDELQKRLGDGYYEQQLIQQQIVALTGQRYLGGHENDIEQYKALMDAGVSFAEQYHLQVGVSLSVEQMKKLTSDIVWLVSKTVMVNGKPEQVLVPQVYVVNRPEVSTDGALLAGKNININSQNDIYSNGNVLAKNQLNVIGQNIDQEGLWKGDSIFVYANDSLKSSGAFVADENISLLAVKDILLNTTTKTTDITYGGNHNSNTVIDKVASVQSKQGDILIHAGNDVSMNGALIVNIGDDSQTQIKAGHDINLNKVDTGNASHANFGKKDYRDIDETHVVGTEIQSNGNISLLAGNDINTHAAIVSADESLKVIAGNDINILASQEHEALTDHHQKDNKRILNNKSTIHHLEIDNTTQKGSELSGDSVTIKAGHDLTVDGSQVVGTQDVNLLANNNVNITAAEESYYQHQQTIKKESGLMGSGGLGVTVGKMKQDLKQTDTEQAYAGSIVGSTNGSVNIQAGKDVNIQGSDVIAQQDIRLKGENVNIEALDAKTTHQEEYKYQKSGVTVAITGTASDIYNANQTLQHSRNQTNKRTKALMEIKAGLQASNAALEAGANLQNGQPDASIGINISLGSEKTKRTVNQEQHTVVGSSVSAGRNVSIIATGNGDKDSGDINILGSQVQAGHDAILNANHDINIIGEENTFKTETKEKSSNGSVSVGYNFGGQKNGFTVSASGSTSKSREKGNGTDWTESIVEAGNKVTLITGNDANIIAGQVKGDKVVADIGHDLNIESKQDTDHYHQKSSSTSVGGSFSWGGTSSVNASTSSTKMNSDWASVTDQSGIYAGKGGFDIKVGNNTDLKGGVIASDAPNSSQNRLDTGSISFSDIENKAKYDVKSSSAGISSSGMPSLPTSRNKKESESSITHSAVSDGTIIIRNESEQKQDIAGLSRDTEHANNELKHIFDKEKEQSIIDQTRLVSEIGGETLTMLNNIDRIKATEEAKKAVEEEKQKSQTPLTEQQEQKIYEDAYNNAMNNGMSAMGSNTRQGIDMAVNIINGLISGDMTGAAAGALAPKIASIIKSQTEHYDPITGERKIDYISNTVCHAILGAVVAELQGNSALAGGLGAAASERGAEIIAGMLYPGKSVDKLSQDEKQQISALAQLATALAVAAGGGDIQDINTAVAGGKNAVENNYLSKQQMHDYMYELQGCSSSGNPEQCAANVQNKYDQMDEEQRQELVDACSTDPYSSACFNYIKNAVDGGIMLFTQADLTHPLGEMGIYSLSDACNGAPNNCYDILGQQDAKNQADADFNFHNPIIIAERASDARAILGYIGIDTTDMTDKEAVDKVSEIGLMASAGIMGTGSGGKNKNNVQKGQMLGENGVQVNSKTIWKGKGKERIDVENPKPGQRPGQIHYQDNQNNKYYYDPSNNSFYSFDSSKNKVPAPSSVNKLLDDPNFKRAIDKGMTQYLGEK